MSGKVYMGCGNNGRKRTFPAVVSVLEQAGVVVHEIACGRH